ncbi:MAG TPA: hypothetical protein DF613_01490 [Lachnospiraceae bacterium]|nr:hypothetical protein [Lachnospiraceae bacterium]
MARELIRDYNRIRPVLEHIYTYGFFSREDFERQGVMKKSGYDKELQRLLSILPPYILLSKQDGKRRYFYIRRDYFTNRTPWLTASYFLHSVKTERICLSLLVLTQLPSTQAQLCLRAEQLPGLPDTGILSTLWRQLRRMEDLGYIEKRRRQYQPPLDPLSGLDRGQLTALYQLTALFAYGGFPRTPAEFLRRSIQREFFIRGWLPPGDAFLFRDNCCRSVFDEQLVCQLAKACQNHQLVKLTKDNRTFQAAPLYVQLDPRMGRWYLVCVDTEAGQALRIRLRLIDQCTVRKETFQAAPYQKIAQDRLSNTYLSTADRSPVRVEVQLLLSADSFLFQQFQREIFVGEVVQRKAGLFYCATVRDPLELKPLLRSYYPYLRICPGQHTLDQEIREELKRMLKHYGTLS